MFDFIRIPNILQFKHDGKWVSKCSVVQREKELQGCNGANPLLYLIVMHCNINNQKSVFL